MNQSEKALTELASEARKIANAKYVTVDVMQYTPDGVRYRTVWVSKEEWAGIGNVDYIEIDNQSNILPEMVDNTDDYLWRALGNRIRQRRRLSAVRC